MKKLGMGDKDEYFDLKFESTHAGPGCLGSILHRRHQRRSQGFGTLKTVPVNQNIAEGHDSIGALGGTSRVKQHPLEPIIIFHDSAGKPERKLQDSTTDGSFCAANSGPEKSTNPELTGVDQHYEEILEILKIQVFKDLDAGFTRYSDHYGREARYGKLGLFSLKKTGLFGLRSFPNRKNLGHGKKMYHNDATSTAAAEVNSFASIDLVCKSNVYEWNHSIGRQLGVIRQRIKRSLKKREPRRVFDLRNNVVLDPWCHFPPNVDENSVKTVSTSSESKSMEKYAHLSENGYGTDAELHHTSSLKSRQDKVALIGQEAESSRSQASLPSLGDTEITNGSRQEPTGADAAGRDETETIDPEAAVKADESPSNEQQIDYMSEVHVVKKKNGTTDPNVESPETFHGAGTASSPHSEGSELKSNSNTMEEQNSHVNRESDELKSLIRCYYKLDKGSEVYFNFVRNILELSGFFLDTCSEALFSTHQQLNPSLLKDVEVLECPEEKLLFDLVNNSIAEIHTRRFSTFNHQVKPVLKGHHILEEVWTIISWYMSISSDGGLSYIDAVARDITKGKEIWPNSGPERECLMLELQDLIFDDILDEVLSCFD